MVQPPKPLVSVVTPTFNSERYLERMDRSVLEQSHDRVEHLIVDGGSTDGTLAVIARYPHLTLIAGRDKNMDALNKGLRAARAVPGRRERAPLRGPRGGRCART